MNALVAALARSCAEHPFADKRLLAPTRRVGRQWLDAAARAGSPSLGCRVETVRSLALELAAPAMAAAGVTVVPRRAALLLAAEAVERLRPARLRYLREAAAGPGFAATVLDSLAALRLAGVDAAALRRGRLEDDGKAADLKAILAGFLELLARERFVDLARVLELARKRLARDPDALGGGALVLVPADLERPGLEGRLLGAVPPAVLRELPVDPPGWAPRMALACGVGEAAEVRAALRSCLAAGVPLDEVELLHTDPDVYVPLVLDLFAAIERPGADPAGEPPATFAEGIPCDRSRPGRALAAWLQWEAAGHPQAALVAMVREGLLETGEPGAERTGFRRLAALLRGVGIGFGRDRYLPKLDEKIAGLERRRDAPAAGGGEGEGEGDDAEAAVARREGIGRDIAALRTLRSLAKRLLDLALPGAAGPDLVRAAREFLATIARRADRLDGYAADRLGEEVGEMERWLDRSGGAGLDAGAWLAALPAGTRVLGSGPRPGRLHVDGVAGGGHSGRPRLLVVGLEEARFPGAGLQDPLLLDSERERVAPGMPTAAARLRERAEGFMRLLARQRGEVTLSWPGRDIVGDRERFPSPLVLAAFRQVAGEPDADLAALLDRVEPESFAPGRPEGALDPGEWWLWRFTEGAEVADAAGVVARHAPHLARGREAAAARGAGAFTGWDGRVPAAGAALDPASSTGRVVSAGGLEAAGACPLRFFFRYGLDIAPPDELAVDPARWLDPLARGLLLHELFEEFLRELVPAGRPPDAGRDRARLADLLEAKVAAARDEYPPPSEAAFRRERADLERTAATFLDEEARHCAGTGCEPLFLEASLGMPPGGHATALDAPDPVPVALPDGRLIRTRGRIDRVDRVPGGYVVWDYKTGGTFGYDRADPFVEGRKVQPWLYVRMVEPRLRAAVDPGARVLEAGYFFPGVKALGERMSWTAARLAAGGAVVGELCGLLAAGAFLPTTDENDCTYCDYRPVCGDVKALAAGARLKALSGEPLLAPLRALRATSLGPAPGEGDGEP